MQLPWHWYIALDWMDQKIASDVARLFYSGARRTFWEHEMQIRGREIELYPEEVIFERMSIRRRDNLNNCYGRIFRSLAIPTHYPRPTLPVVMREIPEVAEYYDYLIIPIESIERTVEEGGFNIREALRFSKPAQFLTGRGRQEQWFVTLQAYERYKEACENLKWQVDQINLEEEGNAEERIRQIRNAVLEARVDWDHHMFEWAQGNNDIRQSILMHVNGVPIPRQFDDIWVMEEEHRRQNIRAPLFGNPLNDLELELGVNRRHRWQ